MLYGQYFSYLLSVYLTIYHLLFFLKICCPDVIWPVLQLSHERQQLVPKRKKTKHTQLSHERQQETKVTSSPSK
jgi:hypothetical protein